MQNRNKTINVLHIIESIHPYGGTPRKLLKLCQNININKFKIYLAFHGIRSELKNDFIDTGTIVISLKKRKNWDFRIIFELVRVIKKYKINLINTHFTRSNIYGSIAGFLTSVPIIQNEHGIPRGASKQSKIPFVINFFDNLFSPIRSKYICNSYTVLNKVKKDIKINHRHMEVVQNSLDTKKFLKEYYSKDCKNFMEQINYNKYFTYFGSIGGFIDERDFESIIKAFSLLHKEYNKTKLYIVGDGKNRTSILNLICDLKLENSVILLGYLDDVICFLKCIDIYLDAVLKASGVGMALMEPMLCQKPVIGFMQGDKRDIIINNNKNGILVEQKNIHQIYSAMKQLLKDKRKRLRMGIEANRTILNKHDIHSYVNNIERIYSDII